MSMHHNSPLGKVRGIIIICCLVLIFGILGCAYLNDKNTTVLDKDEILNNIQNEESLNYSYISSYIKKYGVGNVNAYKINEAESKLENNYYKYGELPSKDVLAKAIVSLFVEEYYDKIDLNNKTVVTDAVLDCFLRSIGDKYAYYRTAPEFEDYNQSLEGGDEFVGIGIQIDANTLEILMVFKDSGAYDAGIRPKDILVGNLIGNGSLCEHSSLYVKLKDGVTALYLNLYRGIGLAL